MSTDVLIWMMSTLLLSYSVSGLGEFSFGCSCYETVEDCWTGRTGAGAIIRGATGLKPPLPPSPGGPPRGRTGYPGGAALGIPAPRGPRGLPGLGAPPVGSPDLGPVADLPERKSSEHTVSAVRLPSSSCCLVSAKRGPFSLS